MGVVLDKVSDTTQLERKPLWADLDLSRETPKPVKGEVAVLRLVTTFVIGSLIWIFASDLLLEQFSLPLALATGIGIGKAILYIAVVAYFAWHQGMDLVRAREVAERSREAADLESMQRLARAAELHDDDHGEHNHRIGVYAEIIGRNLGYHGRRLTELRLAAMLHDVGKVAVPVSILRKPGPLTPEERLQVQQHVIAGFELFEGCQGPSLAMGQRVARSHHERWDGAGYPDGLAELQIPVEARIVAVCDVFDALLSKRPYKEEWPWEDAVSEILSLSGSAFDPAVVRAFAESLPELSAVPRA